MSRVIAVSVGLWLVMLGVWPWLTTSHAHDELSSTVLALDYFAHAFGLGVLIAAWMDTR